MKQITFKQLAISVIIAALLMIFITFRAFCQDTLRIKKVSVPYNGLINKKTGAVEKIWYRKVKVESGYITKNSDGTWNVNGRKVFLKENDLK